MKDQQRIDIRIEAIADVHAVFRRSPERTYTRDDILIALIDMASLALMNAGASPQEATERVRTLFA